MLDCPFYLIDGKCAGSRFLSLCSRCDSGAVTRGSLRHRLTSKLFQVRRLVNCFPDNVFIVPVAIKIQWGTSSILKAELQCMEMLLLASKRWKYYINFTGEEFPLMTNLEFVSILKKLRGANLLEGNRTQCFQFRFLSCDFKRDFTKIKQNSIAVVSICREIKSLEVIKLSRRFLVVSKTNFKTFVYR